MKKLIMAALLVGAALPAFADSAAQSKELFGPRPDARFVCRARNLRGEVFREVGFFPGIVQDRAMAACRSVSAVCRPMGCERF